MPSWPYPAAPQPGQWRWPAWPPRSPCCRAARWDWRHWCRSGSPLPSTPCPPPAVLAPLVPPQWAPTGGPTDDRARRRLVVPLAAACLLPLVCFAAVNQAKFDTTFSVPFERQLLLTEIDANRRAALEANDGKLINVALMPTALLHYTRPDLLGVRSRWPFLHFSSRRPVLIGDVVFDTIDVTSGLPTTMPAFVVLAAGGALATFRRRRPDRTSRWARTPASRSVSSASAGSRTRWAGWARRGASCCTSS